MSETDSCRPHLARYCAGCGLDLGHGGSAIVNHAICIDRRQDDPRRSNVGTDPTHIIGDVFAPLPFKDNTLDFVFSSHCLEDAGDTAGVLAEWCRVLKPGGYLVLFLPDQKTYEGHALSNDYSPNQAHIHKDFSLAFVKARMPNGIVIEHERFPVDYNPYSFELVCQKL